MTEDELADMVAYFPEEMHLVGGPYCGFFLHPQTECLHDVHQVYGGGMIPPAEYRPDTWSPIGWNMIVVNGPLGAAMYLMQSEREWRFHAYWED